MPALDRHWTYSRGHFAERMKKNRPGRTALTRLLRSFLTVLAIFAAGAVVAQGQVPGCPLPWYGATTVYGTMQIRADASTPDGSGGTDTIVENDLVQFKMVNPYAINSPCIWGTSNYGVMGGVISIDDTYENQAQCESGSLVGTGPPAGAPEQYITTYSIDPPTFYFVIANSDVNVIASGRNTCNGTSTTAKETTGWGYESYGYGGPTFSFTSSPMLAGSGVVSTDPSSLWGPVPIDFFVDWQISLTPDDDCKPCEDHGGSELGIQSQSLGENIRIVGTPFSLHYESNRQPGSAGADVVAISDSRMLGGWTLNVHHAFEQLLLSWCIDGSCTPYATVPKALFLGDGSSRNDSDVQSPVVLKDATYLTSEDGSEVYVFKNFQHVQTLRPMTGAVLYNFSYDAKGNLEKITDANGNVTTIRRDADEHPTAIVSPYGQITTLKTDSNGYLSEATDPAGHAIKLTTGDTGLLSNFTDANGNNYKFEYDNYGRVLRDSDSAGGSLTLARTDTNNGYIATETTALGVNSKFQTAFSNAGGVSTTQQFTNTWPDGLVATETDVQGLGQIEEIFKLPDGESDTSTLGPDPRWGIQAPITAAETLKEGSLTMKIAESRNAQLGNGGDVFDVASQTDIQTINGRSYTSIFTGSNRTYVDTTPEGRKVTTALDNQERISSLQVEGLLATGFTYDPRGRLSKVTQGTRTTSYSYNSEGFLANVTDPLGLETRFSNDADGRPLNTTLPDGRIIGFKYDPNGNLASVTPPGKSSHEFEYTPVNLLSVYKPPSLAGTGPTMFAYDPDRDLTQILRPDGKTIELAYDSAGRLSSVTTPTEKIDYAYDAKTGNLDSASSADGEDLSYTYDGPLPTAAEWAGSVNGAVEQTWNDNFWLASQSVNKTQTIEFTYDKDGLVANAGGLTLDYSPENGLLNGTTLDRISDAYTYDPYGELTGYAGAYAGTDIYRVTYARDADGRISGKTEAIGGKTTTYAYTYDSSGRLTKAVENGKAASTYTYDSNSNRLRAVTPSGATSGTYDDQDRLLAYGNSRFTYTANGELEAEATGTQITRYVYDVLGNLISVALPGGKTIEYVIDAENRRAGKKVNGTLMEGFLFDGDRIVAQLNGKNDVVSRFVFATGKTSPDYMISGGETYRIFSDQLGSPRVVVNAASGVVAEEITYDEFGNVLSDTKPGFQPFGFAGGLYDQDTKLVRFGARDYNARIGRWTTKDPIRFSGGDTNLYGYVLNNPVNLTDPKGLQGEDCVCSMPKPVAAPKAIPFVNYSPGVEEIEAMVAAALKAPATTPLLAALIASEPQNVGSISALLPDLPNYHPKHYPSPNECWKSLNSLLKVFLPPSNYPKSGDFNSGGPWNLQGATQGAGEPPESIEPEGEIEFIP